MTIKIVTNKYFKPLSKTKYDAVLVHLLVEGRVAEIDRNGRYFTACGKKTRVLKESKEIEEVQCKDCLKNYEFYTRK